VNYKDRCNSHSLADGAVTLWLIPYTTLEVSQKADDFLRLFPDINLDEAWEADKSAEPDEAGNYPLLNLEATIAETFILIDTLTKVAEFTFAEDTPLAIRGVADYWRSRNGDIANNWQVFKECLTAEMAAQLYSAFRATRDTTGTIAPEAEGGGDATSPATKSRSKPSPRGKTGQKTN